jgi:hypothetical protein
MIGCGTCGAQARLALPSDVKRRVKGGSGTVCSCYLAIAASKLPCSV